MTKQQIFDTVVAGLAKQNFEQCKSSSGTACRYRFRNRRCAVGHLIPDEVYDKRMEGQLVTDFIDTFPEVFLFVLGHEPTENDIRFLDDLQDVHDGAQSPGQMIDDLGEFAWRWDLHAKALQPYVDRDPVPLDA